MKTLDKLRKEIDLLDDEIMSLLNKRFDLTNQIGKIKLDNEIQITNNDRENDILIKSFDFKNQNAIEKVYKEIFNISKASQRLKTYLLAGDGSYSFSPSIHSLLGNDYYQILENVNLKEFLENNEYHFKGINITNPYKKDAYEYAFNNNIELCEIVQKTKVVNFILNGKKKKAFNTDYFGFKSLINHYQVDLHNKDILVLGNGSTSSTILSVLKEYSLKSLNVAVRTKRSETEIYLTDVAKLSNIDIVINTTSFGVYPNLELEPLIDLENKNTSIIIDVNYNPNRSILSIKYPNIRYINGLYMLIEQARIAEEMIQEKEIDSSISQKIQKLLLKTNLNICLIGMPFSGKSTIGEKLSAKLEKTFYDSDIILKEENLSLEKLLSLGFTLEDYRGFESSVIETLATVPNSVISTGGGIIENENNILLLKQNGLIIFIDTPLEILKARIKNDRPLVKDENDLLILYNNRIKLYNKYADIIVNGDQDIDDIIHELEVKINEYLSN